MFAPDYSHHGLDRGAGVGEPAHRAEQVSGRSSAPSKWTSDAFWRAQIIGWLFWALFGVTSRTVVFGDFALALTLTSIVEPLGFALTTLAHRLFRNHIAHDITPTLVGVAGMLSVAGGLLQMLIVNAIKGILPWTTAPDLAIGVGAIPAIYYTLIFMGWALAYLWIRADANAHAERIENSRAQQAALQAELHRLHLQLDSHLLFNALNTIAMEIPTQPGTALEMTHRVAGYLRYSLDHRSQGACPLAEEIEAMRAYMRIHELRFESRLYCTVDMDPAAGMIVVPHLILQPLVENAVKHGLSSPHQRFTVGITVKSRSDEIVIEVSNPGSLTLPEQGRGGVGLDNVRRRLELHYPLRHELSLAGAGNTVVARLRLWGPTCFA
ncbi:MAG: sensor histidine kinase [Alphaproteobacteria bacterium]